MTTAQRKHALKLMQLLYQHRSQFAYPPGDVRQQLDAYDWNLTEQQMTTLLDGGHRIELDCSATASWVYCGVGSWAKSRGPGYTGTWLDLGLPRYTEGRYALLAAPVIFGIESTPTGEHMGLVWKPDPAGGDPVIFQHGRAGVDLLSLSATAAGFHGYTFLNVSRL